MICSRVALHIGVQDIYDDCWKSSRGKSARHSNIILTAITQPYYTYSVNISGTNCACKHKLLLFTTNKTIVDENDGPRTRWIIYGPAKAFLEASYRGVGWNLRV